jgi:HAD superfamily hydrolase (TIGR01509 family)
LYTYLVMSPPIQEPAARHPLLIFDCDGTLVDTEAVHAQATIRAFTEVGVPETCFENFASRFTGHTTDKVYQTLTQEYGLTLPLRADIAKRVHVHSAALFAEAGRVQPTPGCVRMLETLSAYPKAVASNGYRPTVLRSLEQAGLSRFFPEAVVFTKCQVARPKPAPDVFLHAAATMGFAPEHCLVMEDSLAGIYAARAAGMRVLGYTGASEMAASVMLEAGASGVLASYESLPAYL